MDLSNSKPQDATRTVLGTIAVKIAVVVGALGAIAYIALHQSDPLAAVHSPGTPAEVSYVDTTPVNPATPATQISWAAVQSQPTPQRIPGYFPDGYVNQGKDQGGNVVTYEHD